MDRKTAEVMTGGFPGSRWERRNRMRIEEMIQRLSPELQEKARACKSTDELMALGREQLTSLPPEEMQKITGGKKNSNR